MIAMVLLGTTGVSLLSAFSNASRSVDLPENAAYYLATQQLASLAEFVRDDQWAVPSLSLSLNNPIPQPAPETINGRVYSSSYTVNDSTIAPIDANADGLDDYRKVKVRVSWP